ncbi:MAG: PEP-CTERM sorting domain-containing protein [Planctomycetota bacterium]
MNDTNRLPDRYGRKGHSRGNVSNVGFLSVVVPLFFLAGQQCSPAGIVFWDPVDVERIDTRFRLDTGLVRNFGFGLDEGEMDFEIFAFQTLVSGEDTFQTSGVIFRLVDASSFGLSPPFVGTAVATDGSLFGLLLRLPEGTEIGANTPFSAAGTAFDISRPGPFKWAPGDSGFVGLQLSINGQTHYGWAGLELGSRIGDHTLTSFAYETDPDTPIIAGAGASIAGVGAVPEPSTLLVMGMSFGLLALRRRRMWLVRMTKAQLQHMKAKLGKRLPRFISPNSIGVET